MNELYKNFVTHCEKRKMKVKIKKIRYLEMREEYVQKLNWYNEVKKCVDWCYDNEKRIITASRIRNWMNNNLKWNKEKQMKDMYKEKDKVYHEPVTSSSFGALPLFTADYMGHGS